MTSNILKAKWFLPIAAIQTTICSAQPSFLSQSSGIDYQHAARVGTLMRPHMDELDIKERLFSAVRCDLESAQKKFEERATGLHEAERLSLWEIVVGRPRVQAEAYYRQSLAEARAKQSTLGQLPLEKQQEDGMSGACAQAEEQAGCTGSAPLKVQRKRWSYTPRNESIRNLLAMPEPLAQLAKPRVFKAFRGKYTAVRKKEEVGNGIC